MSACQFRLFPDTSSSYIFGCLMFLTELAAIVERCGRGTRELYVNLSKGLSINKYYTDRKVATKTLPLIISTTKPQNTKPYKTVISIR